MFLTATNEDEIKFWKGRTTTYRDILKAHSLNFNVTKLASIRMDLLLQRESLDGVEDGMGPHAEYVSEDVQQTDKHNDGKHDTLVSNADVSHTPGLPLEEFPVDPTLAFGNMYGLEWDFDLDQIAF